MLIVRDNVVRDIGETLFEVVFFMLRLGRLFVFVLEQNV